MKTAVFDCMVFLQAATSDRGPAFACLSLVETSQATLYVSPAILAEVRDVLTRPKICAKFPHWTTQRADLFLQKLATLAVLIDPVSDAGIALRDPNDLPYLNLALAANAAYLVTRDKDLLDLRQEAEFLKNCPNLRIVDPVEFLSTS